MSEARFFTPQDMSVLKNKHGRAIRKRKSPNRSLSDRLKNATLEKDNEGNYWLCDYDFSGTTSHKTAVSHFNHIFASHAKRLRKNPTDTYLAIGADDENKLWLPFLKEDPNAYQYFVDLLKPENDKNWVVNNTSAPVFLSGSTSSFQAVSEELKDDQPTKKQMLAPYATRLKKLDKIRAKIGTLNKELSDLLKECSEDGIDEGESLEEKAETVGDIIESDIVLIESFFETEDEMPTRTKRMQGRRKSLWSFQDRLRDAILVEDGEGNCWLKDYMIVAEGPHKSVSAQFNRLFRHHLGKIVTKTDIDYLALATTDETIISLPFLKQDPNAYQYFLTLLGEGKVTSISSFLKGHGENEFFADLLSKSNSLTAPVLGNKSDSLESAPVSNHNSHFSSSVTSAFSSVNSTLFSPKRSLPLAAGDDKGIDEKLNFN